MRSKIPERPFALYNFLHFGSMVKILMSVELDTLKEKVRELNSILSEETLSNVEKSLKNLTLGQLANFIALVGVYQLNPRWHDKSAIIELRGKRKSYRTTLLRTLSSKYGTKNTRGNKAFDDLIESQVHHIKKSKRLDQKLVYSRRKTVAYRPKGFFRIYSELYFEWKKALDLIEAYYRLIYAINLYEIERIKNLRTNIRQPPKRSYLDIKKSLWESFSDIMSEEEVGKIASDFYRNASIVEKQRQKLDSFAEGWVKEIRAKSSKEYETIKKQIELAHNRFTKMESDVETTMPIKLISTFYESEPKYRDLIKHIRSISYNLTNGLKQGSQYLEELKGEQQKEVVQALEVSLFDVKQLGKFMRFAKNAKKVTDKIGKEGLSVIPPINSQDGLRPLNN